MPGATGRPRGRPPKQQPKRAPRRKGEGAVYKVLDPERKRWREGFRWRAELDLGIVDGKGKVLTHYAATEEAAEEWLANQQLSYRAAGGSIWRVKRSASS